MAVDDCVLDDLGGALSVELGFLGNKRERYVFYEPFSSGLGHGGCGGSGFAWAEDAAQKLLLILVQLAQLELTNPSSTSPKVRLFGEATNPEQSRVSNSDMITIMKVIGFMPG